MFGHVNEQRAVGHTVGLVLGQSKVTMGEVLWKEAFTFLFGEKKRE